MSVRRFVKRETQILAGLSSLLVRGELIRSLRKLDRFENQGSNRCFAGAYILPILQALEGAPSAEEAASFLLELSPPTTPLTPTAEATTATAVSGAAAAATEGDALAQWLTPILQGSEV